MAGVEVHWRTHPYTVRDSSGVQGRPITKTYNKRWDECDHFSPFYFETKNPSFKNSYSKHNLTDRITPR
jgi:hypothetical protein